MSENTALTIIQNEVNKNSLQVLHSENFPLEVQEGINNILSIVNNNTTLPELYSKELQEIPISTSIYQDLCVQMEDHHTPHRKLRQVMLEMGGKLDALDTAKNGHKKSIIKIAKLTDEINELQDIYVELMDVKEDGTIVVKEDAIIDFNLALRMSSINYQVKDGETSVTHEIIPSVLVNSLSSGNEVSDKKLIQFVSNKIKSAMGTKIVDLEEAERSMRSSEHLIKDAALKAAQLQNQVADYKIQIEESGMSFEESELEYYNFYFCSGSENQLRTGDHQIDRGTFGAIGQLPEPIRRRILKNIEWLQTKIYSDHEKTGSWYGDFYTRSHRNLFTLTKTGDGEFEGMNVGEYLKMKPIKILSDVNFLDGIDSMDKIKQIE